MTKEFVELVRQMRLKQNEYFRTRSETALIESRILEAQVDEAIAMKDQTALW